MADAFKKFIFLRWKEITFIFFIAMFYSVSSHAQAVNYYTLDLVPKNGGKLHVIYHRTKVKIITDSGKVIKGRVSFIYEDAVEVENSNIPISDIKEIRYNPGSV